MIAEFVVDFVKNLTSLMKEDVKQTLSTIENFFIQVRDENIPKRLSSSEEWKLNYVYDKLKHIAQSDVSLYTRCDSTKLMKTAAIIAQETNPSFLDVLVCFYDCFPSVRQPFVASTDDDSTGCMRSNKVADRLHLIDELMTAAVDDVQIYLHENSIYTSKDYDDKELEQFVLSNLNIIMTILNKYVLDIDKLISFIKRRQEHYETALSFDIIIDFRKYVMNDSILTKSLADFLQKSNRQNVLSIDEREKYSVLFDSYVKKLQPTQEITDKVSNQEKIYQIIILRIT
ncbi:unnamed protein product [Adineta steineri]|uniref:Uncharacterized protein n=1 Tax=Adineta steineri TaxID=433720 RepID=A0A813P6U2_9BILA|nr:unnamed protein product [Adineta steineri]